MFDWIFPSFFMQNTPSVKVRILKAKKNFYVFHFQNQETKIRVLDIRQLDDLYSLSHPFLTCSETIAHLRQTKVMFLMRGLPGSGRCKLYPSTLF